MDPFIGQIMMFAGNFAPRGWAFCNGQLLDISSHSALFSILGTTYGGDGRSTFGLPDLRGRAPIHHGNSTGPGLSPHPLGQKGGAETVTLTTNQIPPHSHGAGCSDANGSAQAPTNAFPAAGVDSSRGTVNGYGTSANQKLNGGFIENTGGGQAHSNMQPFLAINYVITLEGIFPSRS